MRDAKLRNIYDETLHKPNMYHFVCYGGTNTKLVDVWSTRERLQCAYRYRVRCLPVQCAGSNEVVQSKPPLEVGCVGCNEQLPGILELEEWQKYENQGMENLYKKLKGAVEDATS